MGEKEHDQIVEQLVAFGRNHYDVRVDYPMRGSTIHVVWLDPQRSSATDAPLAAFIISGDHDNEEVAGHVDLLDASQASHRVLVAIAGSELGAEEIESRLRQHAANQAHVWAAANLHESQAELHSALESRPEPSVPATQLTEPAVAREDFEGQFPKLYEDLVMINAGDRAFFDEDFFQLAKSTEPPVSPETLNSAEFWSGDGVRALEETAAAAGWRVRHHHLASERRAGRVWFDRLSHAWRPKALAEEMEDGSRLIDGLFHVVVDEIEDGVIGLSLSYWPASDEGYFSFGGADPEDDLSIAEADFDRLLERDRQILVKGSKAKIKASDRGLAPEQRAVVRRKTRLGDTFALDKRSVAAIVDIARRSALHDIVALASHADEDVRMVSSALDGVWASAGRLDDDEIRQVVSPHSEAQEGRIKQLAAARALAERKRAQIDLKAAGEQLFIVDITTEAREQAKIAFYAATASAVEANSDKAHELARLPDRNVADETGDEDDSNG